MKIYFSSLKKHKNHIDHTAYIRTPLCKKQAHAKLSLQSLSENGIAFVVCQVLNPIRRNFYTGKRFCKVADLVLIREAYTKIWCWSPIIWRFVCLFGVFVHSRIFHSYGDVTIAGEGLQIWTNTRRSWLLSSDGFLACHTYCDTGYPFIMVISDDPWHSHRAFGDGAVTTCFTT